MVFTIEIGNPRGGVRAIQMPTKLGRGKKIHKTIVKWECRHDTRVLKLFLFSGQGLDHSLNQNIELMKKEVTLKARTNKTRNWEIGPLG